jgi:VIT1/CCC1 family predicted Fe2+/Mn2+ transporter
MKDKSEFKDMLKEVLSSTVMHNIKGRIRTMINRLQAAAYHTEKKILQQLVAAVLLIVGLLFIVGGLALLINDVFRLQPQWGFLIVGALLTVKSLFFMMYIKRTRMFKF